MSHLLPSEKLEEQLPKLLPGVLGLYKKHAETVHVSRVRSGVQLQGARGRGDALGAASLSGGRGQEPGARPTWPCRAPPSRPFPTSERWGGGLGDSRSQQGWGWARRRP